jgi:hypothetical protein
LKGAATFIYLEQLSSRRTEALFVVLSVLFLGLFAWRLRISGADALSIVLQGLLVFFLFYSINYRNLVVRITNESLELKFGIFSWTVSLDNVEDCYVDDVPLARIGGAGIHFTSIRGRYRVMFNFLEYPRLVIALKKKIGLVRDDVFSTRHPVEVGQIIRGAIPRREE